MTTETPKLAEGLEPPPGTVAQTGDEENPESRPGEHDNDLKSIYKKARMNRDLVIRDNEEGSPDAAQIAQLVAEAADEGEFEHTASQNPIDLDDK